MHGDGLGTFGRLWQHGILFANRVGGEVDANILVVDLLAIAGNAKALADGIERGDALLAVEHILDGIARGRLWEGDVADVAVVAHAVAGFPKNECANWIAFDDAVEELRGLHLVPNEIALEHGQLGATGIDIRKQDRVFF